MTAQCTLNLWTLKTYLFKQREELRMLRLGISSVDKCSYGGQFKQGFCRITAFALTLGSGDLQLATSFLGDISHLLSSPSPKLVAFFPLGS